MSETTMRARLEQAVADEPPLLLDIDNVRAQGRRLRRRRTTTLAVAGAIGTSVVTAAVAVPLVLAHDSASTQRLTVAPFTFAGAPPATATDGPALTSREQKIADAIRHASPDGWTFDLSADRWEPDNSGVEATANDGTGPGRLLIGISRDPGTQQLHPCTDPEFAAGVSCTERTLPDGSVLSLRGTVDWHGTKYVDIALTHPDGGGVLAEAGNFTIEWPPPKVITPEEKRDLVQRSRPDPVYSLDQLADVVLAVNRAAFGN